MSGDEREPARDSYDAIVDILPGNRARPTAYALLKRTYSIRGDRCVPDVPEPLLHDLRQEDASPRLVPGTDFWPVKNATDFVVRGSAFAPRGIPVRTMTVSAQVGRVRKRIAVFGDRPTLWSDGSEPRIGEPEPFTEMPLTWENAYGGIDFRVEVPEIEGPGVEVVLAVDHPGLYPRNPFGKGYLVEPGEVPEMMMPNLEDPTDLLRDDRLVVGDPRLWYRQPLPWCYDWVHPVSFPLLVYVGGEADAWYPGPEDARMPEVERGFLEPGYRGDALQRDVLIDPDLRFLQGASHGFTVPELKPGTPVVLEGMHPERETLYFALPCETPSMIFEIDGKRIRGRPRLHHLVCYPAEQKLTMVYGATVEMPRAFIPGIHRRIPLAIRIDDDAPLVYETPLTVKERIERGEAERAAREQPAQEESQ